MFLAIALALPRLFWEGAPDTAPALREAGIRHIAVAGAQTAAWKGVTGIDAEAADLRDAVKLLAPAVRYRYDQASASRAPWIDSNGWRFLRAPQGRFYYETAGGQSALAAAEAFAWGANALIKIDAAGLKPLAEMLEFVRGIESADMQPVADFGFIDDGTPIAGEVMNLLARENLLFRVVRAPDPKLKLTVRLGITQYPVEQAKNPAAMAQIVRADLGDDNRSIRIYGTAVVVGRLTAANGRLRVHLINYDAAGRKVAGMRVRVRGEYSKHKLAAAGSPEMALLDYSAASGATEFTLPELKSYAVIDLFR